MSQSAAEMTGKIPGLLIDDSLSFENAMLRLGYRYWRELAGDREMPDRRDIVPADLGSCRPHFSLFNVRTDGAGQIELVPRLVSPALQRTHGGIAEDSLHMVLAPRVLQRWLMMTAQVLMRRAPVRFAGQVEQQDRRYLKFELLLAPLAEGTAEIAGLYVINYFHSTPGK